MKMFDELTYYVGKMQTDELWSLTADSLTAVSVEKKKKNICGMTGLMRRVTFNHCVNIFHLPFKHYNAVNNAW